MHMCGTCEPLVMTKVCQTRNSRLKVNIMSTLDFNRKEKRVISQSKYC